MSREIKFRAYHKSKNRMFPVYGLGSDFVTEDTLDGLNPETNAFQGKQMEDIKVMQFTGSIDINGKEIFESDIVRLGEGFSPRNRPIVFTKYGSWSIGELGFLIGQMKADGVVHCEVIGNIHETLLNDL